MARVGDNIYMIGAQLQMTLREAAWSREKVDAVMAKFKASPSYDDAIALARQYITIEDEEAA